MTNQLSPVALASVILAGGLAIRALPGPFGWLQTLTGLLLLIILFAYDTEDQRTSAQSVAFASVCGFCLMLLSSGFIERWATGPGTVQIAVPGSWLSVVWVVGALVFFFVDLMRMGARGSIASATSAMGTRGAIQPVLPRAASYAPPVSSPQAAQPVSAQPVSAQHVSAQPAAASAESAAYSEPARYAEPPHAEPAYSETAHWAPEPVTAPTPPEAATVQPATPPAPQAPAAHSGPPPKQVSIYVNLLGEGLNMMRDVVAQDLGRGYYQIVEEMPAGETWQFQTGQIVRCQKKNLASGKHLVAIEEAPRA